MQVRDGFAHREEELVVVELALEEEGNRLVGGDGLVAALEEPLEAPLVVLVQLGDALVHAAEDAVVGRQHELRLLFERLERAGVPTHYLATLSEREMACRHLDIIKIEVIVRNIVAGSLAAGAYAYTTASAQQAPAPAPTDRPPTRADILRGEYGRYRANNDLLFYHLDVRVDPPDLLARHSQLLVLDQVALE